MVRLAEDYEWFAAHPDLLPELTEEEHEILEKFNIDKIIAQCGPDERRCWKVTDKWGNTIKRYKTEHEALESAAERNKRARDMGLWMSYRVAKDQGFDE